MTTAADIVARALGATPPVGAHPGECGLCGSSGEPCVSARATLKSGFMNWDELSGMDICWACAACLDDARTRKSHLVDADGFRVMERKHLWPTILVPPEPPFVLYMTSSGKKHGLFRQHVATSRESFRLQCEDMAWQFDRERDQPLMMVAADAVLSGWSRDSLIAGRVTARDAHAVGVDRVQGILEELRPWMGTSAPAVLIGTMPGKDDLRRMMQAPEW